MVKGVSYMKNKVHFIIVHSSKSNSNYRKSATISNEIIIIKKMIFLNVTYDTNRNKEKTQKIANVIIAYGYYQREIKKG